MIAHRPRLFARYAAALMGLTVCVIAAVGVAQLAMLYAEVRESASAVQRSEARAAAVPIEQYLSNIRTALSEVASLPWSAGVFTEKERREEYHRIMKILPAVSEVRWVGIDGRSRLRASRFEVDDDGGPGRPLDAAIISEVRSRGYAFLPAYFRAESEPFVTLVISTDQDPSGLIAAEIDLKFVTDVVRRIRLASEGRVYVASDDRLIAHPNLNLVLRGTDLAGYAPVRALRAALTPSTLTPVGMFEGPGLEGQDVLLSGALVPSTGWIVVAEQPKSIVMAAVYHALLHTVLLMLVSLGAALTVSYALAKRLARPILALRRGVERFSHGDLGARISLDTDDEVSALASDFNAMAAQLEGYTTALEQRVREKTADLQGALELAHGAMRARAIFLAAASHDLRQPLYAISLLADTLAQEEMPSAAAQVLDKQRQAIAVLRSLFDNLLDLSRFDSGDIRPSRRTVALRELLAVVVLEYEVICHSRGIKFESRIDQVWVDTDPELICRVASNLLSNAARYTSAGTVTLEAHAVEGFVSVVISDTGIGIAESDHERIFDEFVQISNPSRDREKGVGLGLSIVRRISKLLELDLVLRSAPGQGTTVTFKIPLAAGTEGAQPQIDLDYAAGGAFTGVRVWIVEDDPLVCEALAFQLNRWGALPAFAASLEEVEGLLEADGTWPQAAMVDDMLGTSESGLDIATWMSRSMDSARIALVTGNVDTDRSLALEASGITVLFKPIASNDLVQWLREAIAAQPATETPAPELAG